MNHRDVVASIREWWRSLLHGFSHDYAVKPDYPQGGIAYEPEPTVEDWADEMRLERAANLTFTPDAETDISNRDHRPPADRLPHEDTRRLPTPWTRPVPRHAGTPDELEDN